MENSELKYWLALWRINGIGYRTIEVLQRFFPSWKDLFELPQAAIQKLKLSAETIAALQNPPWREIEQDLKWQANNPRQHHILTVADAAYPTLLKTISQPPTILFVKGCLETLLTPQIAMVGSRNPSCIGRETAHIFAAELAGAGLTVTSGLAIGIDAACHRGALAKRGKTIAVLGTGINNIYPHQHLHLVADIIAQDGAIISEFPLNAGAVASNFPRRNRVISGMSLGTLILEATCKSGSLITAKYALEQGREVFAIPGSIHNPLARGCHLLLRQGAKLVETAQDVLEELHPLRESRTVNRGQSVAKIAAKKIDLKPISTKKNEVVTKDQCSIKNLLDLDDTKLLECIGYESTAIETIIVRSNFTRQKVTQLLTMLELKGLIKMTIGGYVRI